MRNIRLARTEDTDSIMGLYQELIGTPGCPWNMEYPAISDVKNDIRNSSLYCMCDDNGNIIAVAFAGYDSELENFSWNSKVKKPCELARVGVKKSMQNRGIGYELLEHVIKDVKMRRFDGIQMLVSKANTSALALYEKFEFRLCGEIQMYNVDFYCYEMELQD